MRSFGLRLARGSNQWLGLLAMVLATAGGCYRGIRTSPADAEGGAGSGGSGGTAGGRGGTGATAGTGGSGGSTGTGGTNSGRGGSAGNGGSAGTGGSSNGGGSGTGGAGGAKDLGQGCTGDQQCKSGHCAMGICCDQSCNRPCEQCSSSGACQAVTDDAQCGTIACPLDTICRDYATAITANRCKSAGACKTSADCSYVDAPATTFCDYVRQMTQLAPATCDGTGNCRSRTVKCGGDGECPIDQSWCCSDISSGLTCHVEECGGTPPLGPYLCDEKADCAAGYVCCLQATPGGPSAGCLAPTSCVSDMASSRVQACNPATTPSECSTGTCQPAPNGPIGWHICM